MYNSWKYHLKRKFSLLDPCKEGDCLVKSSCSIYRMLPWERRDKCPQYDKYKKNKQIYEKITSFSWAVFSIFLIFIIIMYAILTVSLGLWEEIKFVMLFF
jgi:hypothetical protein